MAKTLFIMLLLLAVSVCGLEAQVTTEPSPLQIDSKDVTIFFHADQGNRGLAGQPASAGIYAHTGVILDGKKDWVAAPQWGDNSEKYKLTYVSDNVWKLYIGDIRAYYGITDPKAEIERLAFVFRNADCSKEGKTASNGDIFVDIADSGLQIVLESDAGGRLITSEKNKVTFNVRATKPADISLSVNGTEIAKVAGSGQLSAEYTFAGIGDYKVVAKAKTGTESAETDAVYCYAAASKQVAYPAGMPVMGPVRNTDGSVTFCLGAPGKNSVMLVGEWNDYELSNDYVMNYTESDGLRYFWITVNGLENDEVYGYYFLVDGTIAVGDPYARLVLDPNNDRYISPSTFPDIPEYPEDKVQGVPLAIYKGDINDYDWQVKDFKGPEPSDLIIYEMLLRDFTGTGGAAEGNGTVRMAMDKIPYLKKLGVNAVELLPINEFGGNNSWGYNPNFYFAPDKAYGTPDDYKNFIDVCHQNGIAVILDMVFNQSDGQHPWYNMYSPGENPFFNAEAPHAYSVLNDWYQDFPMVQEQWRDVIRYWLTEYNVDGFRFDLVKGLGDNDSYANNSESATNVYNRSRVDRMKSLKDVIDAVKPGAYFINENLATAKEENEMAESGELNWANVNNAGCQFAMGYSSDSNMNRFYAPKDDNRLWGSTVSYLESHDEQRLAYKQNQWGVAGVKGNVKVSMQRLGSAAAQMLLSPGAHMIWQFSELGNAQNTKDANGGNDTSPKIVDWSLLEDPDHKGLYDSYRELIAIRNDNPELFSQSASFENSCGQANWANGRTLVSVAGDKELYTVVNPNVDKAITVTCNFLKSDENAYRIMSESYGSESSFSVASKTVTVPANCYVVIGSVSVAAVDGITDYDEAGCLDAYSSDGRIVVNNAGATVIVYGADGRAIGQISGSGSIQVTPGVYILSCAGKSMKICVR